MSVYEQRVWELIFPEFLNEVGLFGDSEDLAEAVAKTGAEKIPDPNCHKCYGKGVIGSVMRAKTAAKTTLPNGSQRPAPITYQDLKKNNVQKSPIFCKCVQKTIKTIKKLAKEYDESM